MLQADFFLHFIFIIAIDIYIIIIIIMFFFPQSRWMFSFPRKKYLDWSNRRLYASQHHGASKKKKN